MLNICLLRVQKMNEIIDGETKNPRRICDYFETAYDLANFRDRYISLNSQKKVEWRCCICHGIWSEKITRKKKYIYCPECQPRKKDKICIEGDCATAASYNYPDCDWGIFCSIHRKEGMVEAKARQEYKDYIVKHHRCDGRKCKERWLTKAGIICPHNNLETVCPELCKEWDNDRNKGFRPSEISFGSKREIAWVCRNGHQWTCNVSNRVYKNSNCPVCSKLR